MARRGAPSAETLNSPATPLPGRGLTVSGDVAAFGLGGLPPLATPCFVSSPARQGLAPVGAPTAASASFSPPRPVPLPVPQAEGRELPAGLGRDLGAAGPQAQACRRTSLGRGDAAGRARHDGPSGATGATGYGRAVGLWPGTPRAGLAAPLRRARGRAGASRRCTSPAPLPSPPRSAAAAAVALPRGGPPRGSAEGRAGGRAGAGRGPYKRRAPPRSRLSGAVQRLPRRDRAERR